MPCNYNRDTPNFDVLKRPQIVYASLWSCYTAGRCLRPPKPVGVFAHLTPQTELQLYSLPTMQVCTFYITSNVTVIVKHRPG
jgi:hypothetical protein